MSAGRPIPVALIAAALVLAASVAGCGIAAPSAPVPSDAAPSASVGAPSGAVELTRGLIEAALRPAGLALVVPRDPFRPPESVALVEVPRAVFRVVLADPTAGLIVVYEFPDAAGASSAGRAQAAWLASGPGAIQFPPGTTHVIRVVGTTLVTFSYPPADAADPGESQVAAALGSVGQGVPVGP